MSALLVAAALLAVLIGLAHSILGERYVLTRLFRSAELPVLFGGTEFTRRTLRFAWHITTIAWWGIAAVLLLYAGGTASQRNVLLVVAATFLATGLTALIGSAGRHFSWIVFFAIAGLAAYAALA